MKYSVHIILWTLLPFVCTGQHEHHHAEPTHNIIANVEPQPLLAQALRLNEALSFLGSALSKEDQQRLQALRDKPLSKETIHSIQAILDPYCLVYVDINAEARVKVTRGNAPAKLMQHGWTSFLVKVRNDAGVTAKLLFGES